MGTCCSEMDLWEANKISAAYTPHNCNTIGGYACTTPTDCGDGSLRYSGVCDKDGCDFNSYRMGNTTFYGPGMTIDTTKLFTVVTQFLTDDGTSTGNLVEIRRFYVQNGVVYANSQSNWPGISGNSVTENFCKEQKSVFGDNPYFETLGGLAAMGKSLSRGHVLAMSLWDDHAVDLLWLDAPYPTTADPTAPGVARGTCSDTSGAPSDVEANVPNSSVTYSNIRIGELGSTFSDPQGVASNTTPNLGSGGVTTTTTSKITTKTTTKPTTTPSVKPTTTSSVKPTTTKAITTKATTTSAAPGMGHYMQCGGIGYTGGTSCASPYTCHVLNPYYSQCL